MIPEARSVERVPPHSGSRETDSEACGDKCDSSDDDASQVGVPPFLTGGIPTWNYLTYSCLKITGFSLMSFVRTHMRTQPNRHKVVVGAMKRILDVGSALYFVSRQLNNVGQLFIRCHIEQNSREEFLQEVRGRIYGVNHGDSCFMGIPVAKNADARVSHVVCLCCNSRVPWTRTPEICTLHHFPDAVGPSVLLGRLPPHRGRSAPDGVPYAHAIITRLRADEANWYSRIFRRPSVTMAMRTCTGCSQVLFTVKLMSGDIHLVLRMLNIIILNVASQTLRYCLNRDSSEFPFY
ncbi:hypothetical protein ANN_06687 [Periplaneta americana]|uniref:Uncharacterized protein n=1 Tax=Periplaneta americana TaxID=6978 RepID=A0ABQ8TG42_PERAM|nr:hypothetical protein ANN_06687 [Periplaneta americana]